MVLDSDVDLSIDNRTATIRSFLNAVANGTRGEWLTDFHGRKICSHICGTKEQLEMIPFKGNFTMRTHSVLVGLSMALIAFPGLCDGQSDGDSGEPKPSPELELIRKNAEAFVDAFNKADAKAVAALWAPTGEMSLDGKTLAKGREAVEKSYAEYFEENAGTTIGVTIESIRLLDPRMAVEKGISEIVNDDDESVVDAYTLIHVNEVDRWLIASADVRQKILEPEFDWKKELGFLEGTWKAEQGDWHVEATFEWVANGNFLRRTFKVYNGEDVESSGVQVIGWDPLEQSVTSWVFGSNGGHGRGWWTLDGIQWVVEADGTTAGGEVITATNVLTILDNDTFRWQSTNRSIEGYELEDTDSIRVSRVQTEK